MIAGGDAIGPFHCSPEELAENFRSMVFDGQTPSYPLNPFAILNRMGVPFVFRNLQGLEGVLIVDDSDEAGAVVAINSKRPVQRQRFTCAHEICHLHKDVTPGNRTFSCPIGSRDSNERYAESFAASLLMGRDELLMQVENAIDSTWLTVDDIVVLGEHFGTSFQSCVYRIFNCVPTVLPPDFKRMLKKARPLGRRKAMGYSDASLYSQILDSWTMCGETSCSLNADWAFDVMYVYNGLLMDSVVVTQTDVGQALADIRVGKLGERGNEVESQVCQLFYLLLIAFENCRSQDMGLGLVLEMAKYAGGLYGPVSSSQIDLLAVDKEISALENGWTRMTKSEVLGHIVMIHCTLARSEALGSYRGRIARAFMVAQLLRYGFPPVYIDWKDSPLYSKALASMDCSSVYEIVIQNVFKSHAAFFSSS